MKQKRRDSKTAVPLFGLVLLINCGLTDSKKELSVMPGA